jgi:hypothetical protein
MTTTTEELKTRLETWFESRVPSEWRSGPVELEVDQEEAFVILPRGVAGDPSSFRNETRESRIRLAQQAEEAFGVKVSWGVSRNGRRQMFTTARATVTVPLAMSERQVLEALVAAGVAQDRADAVAWCIRLVGQHEADWLQDLREALAAAPGAGRERPVAM